MKLSELIVHLTDVQKAITHDPIVTVNGEFGAQDPKVLSERYLCLDTPDACWEYMDFLCDADVDLDYEILHIGEF